MPRHPLQIGRSCKFNASEKYYSNIKHFLHTKHKYILQQTKNTFSNTNKTPQKVNLQHKHIEEMPYSKETPNAALKRQNAYLQKCKL